MSEPIYKSHLTTKELAERLSVSVRTVEKWRYEKTGPAFIKINGAVRYPVNEIIRFEQQSKVLR